MKHSIYLDYAAATPMDPRVLEAMQPYYAEQFYNPSALYLAAKKVGHELADARSKAAAQLGARPAEVIFTAGGTEANNLAIHGIMEQFPEGNMVVSAVEHESVLRPAERYTCRQVAVQADGTIDLAALEAAIDDKTVLVSVMYANNEVGTIQPLKEAAMIIEQKRRARGGNLPLYFHTDACQAANYLDLHVSRLGVDLLTLNGGKMYGPKQSGALYVGAHVQLQPLVLGGGQERGLRSGTENVAQVVGFATALSIAQASQSDEVARLQALQKYFFDEIEKVLPEVTINGSRKKRLPNNLHVTIPGVDNERLLMQLDEAGILAAAGSACSASDEEPSHVLRAMGIGEADAQSSLRFTMGRQTTKANIDALLQALQRFCS
ncbi:MAG TPA: cysteine desulfurase family protein [Candidatus Microsaccharimonas sp.]|nr:cysteine desulfurase family protein [Candidatus Microsaccharimonas sp.]